MPIPAVRRLLIAALPVLALAGCAGPMTRPPGPSCRAVLPLHEPVDPTAPAVTTLLDDTIARKRAANPGGQVVVTILALSGGGKYGAFGAGFLAGWSAAERDGQIVPVTREEVDIVTGISTGALLASYAAAGNLPAPAGGSDALRRRADADAEAAYDVSDAQLFRRRGILAALTSNGLTDPKGLLAERVRQSVRDYLPSVASLPLDHKVLIGAANLTNGKFYVADLREAAQHGDAAVDCTTEWLLASAAVPAAFPPRFLDGQAYVDGGVRFGAFLGNDVQRVARRRGMRGDLLENADVKVNLIALFNNPITANSPAKDPAAALACDRSTLETALAACPDRSKKNKLLDIATRAAGDILTNQVYLDSLYRLQRELEAADLLGLSKFVYAAPERIAAAGCRAETADQFDRAYMRCLYKLGFATGRDATLWQDFTEVPRVRAPVTR